MKTNPKERGQLLILLGAWLFFGGSASGALLVYDRSPAQIEKAVKQAVVTDDARRDVILTYIDEWQSALKNEDKQLSAARAELVKTLRRKDATRSQVDPITARLDATFADTDRNYLDALFRVKAQTTPSEWAAILAQR